MRKIILSISVILIFAGYTIHQKVSSPLSTGLSYVDTNKQTGITNDILSEVFLSNGARSGTNPVPTPNKTISTNSQRETNVQSVPSQVVSDPVVTTPLVQTTPVGQYKDGQYTGAVVDAYYGNVQVQAIISGGKITDVKFLDYPKDRSNSIRINTQAMPWLKSEAIVAQSANVDIISGATATSQAFIQSLSSALIQAKV